MADFQFINTFPVDMGVDGNPPQHMDSCIDGSTHTNVSANANGSTDASSNVESKTNAADDKTYSLCPRVYFTQFQDAWLPYTTPKMKQILHQVQYQRLSPERFNVYNRYLQQTHDVSHFLKGDMQKWCEGQLRQGKRVSRRQVLQNIRHVTRQAEGLLDGLDEQLEWEMRDLEKAEAESLRRRLEMRRLETESRRRTHESWM